VILEVGCTRLRGAVTADPPTMLLELIPELSHLTKGVTNSVDEHLAVLSQVGDGGKKLMEPIGGNICQRLA
jgi:hypothetical protein